MKIFKIILKYVLITSLSAIIFLGCEMEEEKFTGLKISGGNRYVEAGAEVEITAVFYKDDSKKSVEISFEIINDTTGAAGLSADKSESGMPVTVTVGSKSDSLVGIRAKYDSYTAITYLGVAAKGFALDNTVPGFAGLGVDSSLMTEVVTVTTPDGLIQYAKKGGYVIYIDSAIDMSRGMLPPAGSVSTASTSLMDAFVAENTTHSTYAEFLKTESNVGAGEDTKTSAISNAYKSKIQIQIASNTAIIGKGENAVIRGGSFSVKSNNVIIRNLTLQDAADPFPHHESGDGWNSQHDCISIDSGSNIWIDHCTLEDTLKLGTAANGEKWQIYDGLCDIKSNAYNITVSNCIFRNHDKTMLIGSGDSDGSNETRTVSLMGNMFLNCSQRCPMVRNTKIHVLNNVYKTTSGGLYGSSYCIGNRKNALIVAEGNVFGASGATINKSDGIVTSINNSGLSNSGSLEETFNPYDYYGYIPLSASAIKNSINSTAGAGILTVE